MATPKLISFIKFSSKEKEAFVEALNTGIVQARDSSAVIKLAMLRDRIKNCEHYVSPLIFLQEDMPQDKLPSEETVEFIVQTVNEELERGIINYEQL